LLCGSTRCLRMRRAKGAERRAGGHQRQDRPRPTAHRGAISCSPRLHKHFGAHAESNTRRVPRYNFSWRVVCQVGLHSCL
jgi:hypothetical protein